MGAAPVNARWVRERRIERVGRTATLHTDLGSWPLRGGVVPDEVPVREVLKGRLRVDGAEVQLAGVLDDLYDASDAALGPTWEGETPSVAVWAPTAQHAHSAAEGRTTADDARRRRRLARHPATRRGATPSTRSRSPSSRPPSTRVVTNVVTDPYSLALTLNSTRSVLARLEPPRAWPKPPPARAIAIYELHIRDFSIGDTTVPEAHRGTYLAFTHSDSAGMRHLRALAEAGMTTVHLLPCNDIATIEEDRAKHLAAPPLEHLPPHSPLQQRQIGQDPRPRTASTGAMTRCTTRPRRAHTRSSRSTAPNEFRAMVEALNAIGLRVVLDVVYNHTPNAGQDPKSILDRIVPGYYHRLNDHGHVESSTCCANTASEHRMMEKLMLDSLATWVREYRVDGFRFDLMGHHTRANLLKVREQHPDLQLYGEGWSFGEVADDRAVRRGVPAQHDRHRDRDLRRPVARRRPRRRPARSRPAAAGLRDRAGRLAVRPTAPRAGGGHARARRHRRPDRLRRRPRQRDAVRHARAQAPAGRRAWTTACG